MLCTFNEGSEPFDDSLDASDEEEILPPRKRKKNKKIKPVPPLPAFQAEDKPFSGSFEDPFSAAAAVGGQPDRPTQAGTPVGLPNLAPFGQDDQRRQDEEKSGSDFGFFAGVQESFPDISDFGLSWEPKKIRSKRSALKNPFYYRDERPRPPRRRKQRGQQRPIHRSTRRSQGPAGFWDDVDFDSDFFNGGGPATFNSYEEFGPPSYNERPPRREPEPPIRYTQQPTQPPIRHQEVHSYRPQQQQQAQPPQQQVNS